MVLKEKTIPESSESRSRLLTMWLGGLLTLALICVLAMYINDRFDREIKDVPELERNALYERAFDTLKTSCTRTRGPKLTDYCRSQAEFIRHFPQCGDECRELSARFAPQPSR